MNSPYISKLGEYGHITAWRVNGEYIRTHIDEEFTNFGQHYRFPFIPVNEFWIDQEAAGDEVEFYVDHLLVEYKLMAGGADYDTAIAAADKVEQAARKRDSHPEANPHKEFWKSIGDLHVWIVNGETVRDKWDDDWTEGGHDLIYKFIPSGEIWIDDDLVADERKFILLHEYHERCLMANGMPYAEAHNDSSRVEQIARRDPERLNELMQASGSAGKHADSLAAWFDYALMYVAVNNLIVPDATLAELRAKKSLIAKLSRHSRSVVYADSIKSVYPPTMTLEEIQAQYNTQIYSAMDDYTQSDKSITQFRNTFRREINDAFNAVVYAGWIDGGGNDVLPDELRNYINGEITKEIGFCDGVFTELKQLRIEGDPDKIANFIQQRADGYSNALEGYYNYALMFAQRERPGLWVYGDTVQHCEDNDSTVGCSTLEGQTHPLSWYLEKGYIPRQRGSTVITCGCWRCDCSIVDPKTGDRII